MTKNINSLGLLRNGKVYANKSAAIQGLTQAATNDGVAKLARYLYGEGAAQVVRTVVGFYAKADEIQGAEAASSYYTILDIEGSAADIQELREAISAINETIGDGISGTTLTDAINDINTRLGSGFTADHTVADALAELEASLTEALTVTLDVAGVPTEGYLKTYELKQGGNLVGKIDIPKDLVVESGSLVHGTWDGDTFTEDPAGTDTAIKLVIANQENPIYINTKDLVDFYTGSDGIDVDNAANVISLVIDPETEEFLVLGANGLKVTGIQVAIDKAVEDAKLKAGNGISIASQTVTAVAAKFSADAVENPISVDEDGIKFAAHLDQGFYDDNIVVASSAADIAGIADPSDVDLFIKSNNAAKALTKDMKFDTIALDGVGVDSSLQLNANDITVNNMSIAGGKDAGNGKINFTASTVEINAVNDISGSTVYNVFEGNQTGEPNQSVIASNIVIDNPALKHNVINVYKPANDAELMIKDSSFNMTVDNSNAMRVSNYGNATGVTVTFKNVDWTYENSVSATDWGWAGLLIYQPSNADAGLNGDLTAMKTWKFNFINCRYNGVPVTANNFGEHNQVFYMYNVNKTGAVSDPVEAGLDVKFA